MAEHVNDRIMKVATATVNLINGVAPYNYDIRTVYTGRMPPDFADLIYPAVMIVAGRQTFEDSPNPLYSRRLEILGEVRLKIEDRSTDAEQQIWRVLADLERAFGANPQAEETVGNPATKLIVEWRFTEAIPFVDFPSFPICTLSFTLEAVYRTLRSDPTAPR